MNRRSRRERWILRNRRMQTVMVYNYVTRETIPNRRYSGMSLRLLKAFQEYYESR